jgi:murein DD-endopeptidase MepM/ murein hydrolase activator NlpD
MTCRRWVPTVLVILGILAASAPVLAQTAEDERDDVRQDQENAETALDILKASNAEIEQEVERLQGQVREEEAAMRAAEQALQAARREEKAAKAQITQTRDEIDGLQTEAEERAVQAYINPDADDTAAELAGNDDINRANRIRALLNTVSARTTDVLDLIGRTEDDLEVAKGDAQDAQQRVAAQIEKVQERKDRYEKSLKKSEKLQGVLETRIDDVQEEIEAPAAEEASLTATIQAQASQAPIVEGGAIQTPGGSVDPPASASGLIWPTSGTVTSEYGTRWGRLHAGMDIAASTGTRIYAANGGRVLGGCGGGYGNCVLIDHGGGFVTLYAHLNQVFVSGGQVSRGQNIGTMGCTGSCTGPHLHFETRINGSAQNPRSFLP